MRKTFLFMDTVVNKVDTKGRVSLPSDYRAIVKELSTEIVCYRSLTSPCIEGCPEELLEKLADTAVFVGKGRKFQIWNPDKWAEEESRIRAEVLKKRPSLKLPAQEPKA